MASKTTLNAKNLEALDAARLAVLLIEISTGSAVAKRRLRLELAGAQSPKEAGREVAKRLTSIARARSFVNWQNRKPLVTDLESQLRAIKEQIAPADPAEALAPVVQTELKRGPDSGVTEVTRLKRGGRLKIFVWDGTGMVLIYKVREQGSFAWLKVRDGVMRLSHHARMAPSTGRAVVMSAQSAKVSQATCAVLSDWRERSFSAPSAGRRDDPAMLVKVIVSVRHARSIGRVLYSTSGFRRKVSKIAGSTAKENIPARWSMRPSAVRRMFTPMAPY